MKIRLFDSARELAEAGADAAAEALGRAIAERGGASLVAATGKSQIEFLNALTPKRIDWAKHL